MSDEEVEELERLRRYARAMGAVNRQLQAQLEGGGGRLVPGSGAAQGSDLLKSADGYYVGASAIGLRRGSRAGAWLEQLYLNAGAGDPFLVRVPSGRTYVVEGQHRREIKSGLLAAALEQRFGAVREAEEEELQRWAEGAPVEVLEGPSGPAFVIVGGRRLPIRGIPLPYPVGADEMQLFPEGEELNVSAANVPRTRLEHALTGRLQVQRVRSVLAREGLLRSSATLARRGAGRLRRLRTRTTK
jgi:hypothetical protein